MQADLYHYFSLKQSGLGSCFVVFDFKHYANKPLQYADILKGCKNYNFLIKKMIQFLIFAKNIDCRFSLRRSKEYPQSMF